MLLTNIQGNYLLMFSEVMECMYSNLYLERGLSMEENIAELKKFLAGVGVDNPHSSQCGGLDVFSFPQATEVVDYISSTLFQHYKLYQYLFTEEKAAEVIELQVCTMKLIANYSIRNTSGVFIFYLTFQYLSESC